jgi:hypothetical protein
METGDAFGMFVSSAADYNGDGKSEILVGAPGGFASSWLGYVRVFSSASGAPVYTAFSDTVDDAFGTAADTIPDVTGDGVPDIVIGSPNFTSGGLSLRGRVQIFAGPVSNCNPSADLYLQNQTETGTKMYKASNTIAAGNAVTSPPYGDYNVSGSAANVSLQAGSSIRLAPGFSAASGAAFSAEVIAGS